MKFILGKKIEMTQKFDENGNVTPVTAVKAGPCTISQVKTNAKDGYRSVQVGFEEKKKLTKALTGHLKGLPKLRTLREYRLDQEEKELTKGQEITASVFNKGDKVNVTGVSKGKGFQGVVKRHGFHGSPASHGHKDQLRMPGSIGATGPAHVFKGTRMPGRMGGDQVTVSNLEVVDVDAENGILFIKGAIPGHRNSLVSIVAEGDMDFNKETKEYQKDTKEKEVKETPKDDEKKDNEGPTLPKATSNEEKASLNQNEEVKEDQVKETGEESLVDEKPKEVEEKKETPKEEVKVTEEETTK